jgi:hypothetical protein
MMLSSSLDPFSCEMFNMIGRKLLLELLQLLVCGMFYGSSSCPYFVLDADIRLTIQSFYSPEYALYTNSGRYGST